MVLADLALLTEAVPWYTVSGGENQRVEFVE
jgi:hypothetical protein